MKRYKTTASGHCLVSARTCNGCKALEHFDRRWVCRLHGFECDPVKGVPLADCPKPKSNKAMVEINIELSRENSKP